MGNLQTKQKGDNFFHRWEAGMWLSCPWAVRVHNTRRGKGGVGDETGTGLPIPKSRRVRVALKKVLPGEMGGRKTSARDQRNEGPNSISQSPNKKKIYGLEANRGNPDRRAPRGALRGVGP